VALVGKIQDVPPAEIMVFLSESAKTGKLSFTTGTQEGMIVFREGKIIYAASSTVRETFGSIALSLRIIDRRQLDKAVRLQHHSRVEKRLGEILVQMEAMTEADVQKVLTHQVSQVIREIFEWKSGYFRFRNLEIQEPGDVEVDARDFIAGMPLDARSVALDAAREQDEASKEPVPPEKATMAQIMAEVAGPALTAETINDIFQVAAATVARGVIFAVREQSSLGLAQFGLLDTETPASERIRQLVLPLDEYSLISTVVHDGQPFRGALDNVRANSALVKALEGGWPTEVIVIPMIVGGRVALVFYGDNLSADVPMGSTEDIERIMTAIGRRLTEVAT
jgi:hypothetical protein